MESDDRRGGRKKFVARNGTRFDSLLSYRTAAGATYAMAVVLQFRDKKQSVNI